MSLAGRRLKLRPLVDGDAPALFEAIAASKLSLRRRFRWVEAVHAESDAAAFIRSSAEAAERGATFVFGAFETKNDKLVGIVAFDPVMSHAQRAQLALWIRTGEEDKGYAVEAGRLAVDYGFRKLALHRLSARIDPTNRAARKVLQKIGFHYEGCLRQDKRLNSRWIDQECWGQLKSEWKPQPAARSRK
ncbi:MAG: GNAT family N-acetyltransferase [Elusimicrobia bacterium]|nr:GNAT family N-acetyltransferase [Elusimicrobiota bacterium]